MVWPRPSSRVRSGSNGSVPACDVLLRLPQPRLQRVDEPLQQHARPLLGPVGVAGVVDRARALWAFSSSTGRRGRRTRPGPSSPVRISSRASKAQRPSVRQPVGQVLGVDRRLLRGQDVAEARRPRLDVAAKRSSTASPSAGRIASVHSWLERRPVVQPVTLAPPDLVGVALPHLVVELGVDPHGQAPEGEAVLQVAVQLLVGLLVHQPAGAERRGRGDGWRLSSAPGRTPTSVSSSGSAR